MLQMHEAQMSSASQLRWGLSQRQLNMIALGLVDKARAAYAIPVTHVISRQRAVDLAAAPFRAT
jgi:hypothetical protein